MTTKPVNSFKGLDSNGEAKKKAFNFFPEQLASLYVFSYFAFTTIIISFTEIVNEFSEKKN